MTQLTDVNTTDILDAVRLGCRAMISTFNADDNDVPFFRAAFRREPELEFNWAHTEAHVPGRHLNALLTAEAVSGVAVDEDAVEKHARAAFYSYSGSVTLPLNRQATGGPLVNFLPHNLREGFHALYSLAKFRDSSRARRTAEAGISAVFEYWDPAAGWDYDRLKSEHGLNTVPEATFINGIARAIGPLAKYYRATRYGPALELAVILKEKAIGEFFADDGGHDSDRFGTHSHSTTSVMSSLAQLADLTSDSTLMQRVKSFYDNGLWAIRDELGWSPESHPFKNADQGESNNTGDIVETALILGRWGYTGYYHDAERILRSHLLPSQLRDVSWIDDAPNPDGRDGRRDVADRLRGAFGTPASYGHEPVDMPAEGPISVAFNLDIVGGVVGSLCEAYRDVTRYDKAGHWVNLLFDHETAHISVESPYTHPALRITPRSPGPLFVRIPPWVDIDALKIEGATAPTRTTNGYLLFPNPATNRPLTLNFPLTEQHITLNHRTRDIEVRVRGDQVIAMQNHGADLTYFDPLE